MDERALHPVVNTTTALNHAGLLPILFIKAVLKTMVKNSTPKFSFNFKFNITFPKFKNAVFVLNVPCI